VTALVRALPKVVGLIVRLVMDPTLPRSAKIGLAAAILYLVSPFDVVPDIIPLAGVLDDAAIAAVVLDGVLNWVDRRLVLRYWPGSPASLDRLARVARLLAAWVPSRVKARIFSPAR
jgi:uncharacterized membrane protein YkvA (DUF1232 family)